MINRRKLLATTLAAAAIVPRSSLGQTMRKVKMGSAFTTTTNAAFLMPKYRMPEGIDAEIITFPSLVQRMQAVASGDVDVGNGGLSATMQVATKGFPDVGAGEWMRWRLDGVVSTLDQLVSGTQGQRRSRSSNGLIGLVAQLEVEAGKASG